jgi:hypothetical protein
MNYQKMNDAENPPKEGFFSKMKTAMNKAGTSVVSGTKSAMGSATEMTVATMNAAKNMPYIIILCAVGFFFFMIAMFYLPMALLVPQKFSLAFAVACGCLLGAVALIKGNPSEFFMSFLSMEKIKFTIAYAVCFVGTFVVSLGMHSQFFTLLFAFGQVLTSLYLIAISVPGGWKFVEICQMIAKQAFKCIFDCFKEKILRR